MSKQLVMATEALSRVFSGQQKYATIQQQLNDGVKALRPGHLYFGKKLVVAGSPSGIIEVIMTKDEQGYGIRNIDKAKLPDGEMFIATGVSFQYGVLTSNSGKDADQVLFSNKIYNPQGSSFVEGVTTGVSPVEFGLPTYEQRIPTKFLNAELELRRGNNIYFKSLIQKLCKENNVDNSDGVNVGNSSVSALFPSAIVFDWETQFKAEIKFPEGGTAPSADHFVRLEWDGFMISDF